MTVQTARELVSGAALRARWERVGAETGKVTLLAGAGGALLLSMLLLKSPAAAAVGVVAMILLLLTVLSPYLGVLLLLVFTYLRPVERLPALQGLYFVRLYGLLVVAAWLVQRWQQRSTRPLLHHPVLLTAMAGGLVMALSSVTSLWRHQALVFTRDYGVSLLMLVATADLLYARRRLAGYLTLLVGIAIWLVAEQLAGYHPGDSGGQAARTGGFGAFLGDSNDFGLAMLVFLPFIYYTALWGRRPLVRLAAAATVPAMLWSVVATGSRGDAIGLIVVCGALWAKSRRKGLAALCLMAALAGLWAVAPPAYRERVQSISSYRTDATATVRRTAWHVGVQLFYERPVFGIGPACFETGYWEKGSSFGVAPSWRSAHSLYVQTLAELGLSGITWLAALALAIFASTRRTGRQLTDAPEEWPRRVVAHGAQVSLIAYLSAGAFLSCLYYPYLSFLAGLVVAGERTARREPERAASGRAAG